MLMSSALTVPRNPSAHAAIQTRDDPVIQVRQIRRRQEYFNDARLDKDKQELFIHRLTCPRRLRM